MGNLEGVADENNSTFNLNILLLRVRAEEHAYVYQTCKTVKEVYLKATKPDGKVIVRFLR